MSNFSNFMASIGLASMAMPASWKHYLEQLNADLRAQKVSVLFQQYLVMMALDVSSEQAKESSFLKSVLIDQVLPVWKWSMRKNLSDRFLALREPLSFSEEGSLGVSNLRMHDVFMLLLALSWRDYALNASLLLEEVSWEWINFFAMQGSFDNLAPEVESLLFLKPNTPRIQERLQKAFEEGAMHPSFHRTFHRMRLHTKLLALAAQEISQDAFDDWVRQSDFYGQGSDDCGLARPLDLHEYFLDQDCRWLTPMLSFSWTQASVWKLWLEIFARAVDHPKQMRKMLLAIRSRPELLERFMKQFWRLEETSEWLSHASYAVFKLWFHQLGPRELFRSHEQAIAFKDWLPLLSGCPDEVLDHLFFEYRAHEWFKHNTPPAFLAKYLQGSSLVFYLQRALPSSLSETHQHCQRFLQDRTLANRYFKKYSLEAFRERMLAVWNGDQDKENANPNRQAPAASKISLLPAMMEYSGVNRRSLNLLHAEIINALTFDNRIKLDALLWDARGQEIAVLAMHHASVLECLFSMPASNVSQALLQAWGHFVPLLVNVLEYNCQKDYRCSGPDATYALMAFYHSGVLKTLPRPEHDYRDPSVQQWLDAFLLKEPEHPLRCLKSEDQEYYPLKRSGGPR